MAKKKAQAAPQRVQVTTVCTMHDREDRSRILYYREAPNEPAIFMKTLPEEQAVMDAHRDATGHDQFDQIIFTIPDDE